MLEQQITTAAIDTALVRTVADAAQGSISRRRHARRKANWAAQCKDRNGHAWDATVVDCSIGGLGLDRCPVLEVDQVIQVSLKDIGTFLARVAWTSGERAGVELQRNANHLDDAEVDTLSAGLSTTPFITHNIL